MDNTTCSNVDIACPPYIIKKSFCKSVFRTVHVNFWLRNWESSEKKILVLPSQVPLHCPLAVYIFNGCFRLCMTFPKYGHFFEKQCSH